MTLRSARVFYDLISAHNLASVLELGFAHGVSTAYIAGAIQEMGQGHVTSVDLTLAQARSPNIEQVLQTCGLREKVDIFYEPKTFNWRLMKFLEEEPPRSFNLCYLGGHTWVETGYAFCLIRQMLRPDGWVVFGDLSHTYRSSRNRDSSWVLRLSEDEQTLAQVERVFTLIVMRDPSFDTFRRIGRLGFAHKRPAPEIALTDLDVERQICNAANLARTDPEFRYQLLRYPSAALASLSRASVENDYRHIRFAESDLWSPLAPDVSDNGVVTHFLEKPEWESDVTESTLVEWMRNGVT